MLICFSMFLCFAGFFFTCFLLFLMCFLNMWFFNVYYCLLFLSVILVYLSSCFNVLFLHVQSSYYQYFFLSCLSLMFFFVSCSVFNL